MSRTSSSGAVDGGAEVVADPAAVLDLARSRSTLRPRRADQAENVEDLGAVDGGAEVVADPVTALDLGAIDLGRGPARRVAVEGDRMRLELPDRWRRSSTPA